MSGLVLKIGPGERFLVNGALLENGDKPSRIRIKDNDARVLRCSDALKPDQVNTPLKQIYFAIQLLITGDLVAEKALPSIHAACANLVDVFEKIDPDMMPVLQSMIKRGNYYSALCHLRGIFPIEESLLARKPSQSPTNQNEAA